MAYFNGNIEKLTLENNNYRHVLYTSPNRKSQLVIMCLKPNEEIGEEIHPHIDQFIRIEKGIGKAYIDNKEINLSDGIAIVVPAGSKHNIINTGNDNLKLYTIYTPAEHSDGLIQNIKPKENHKQNGGYTYYKIVGI